MTDKKGAIALKSNSKRKHRMIHTHKQRLLNNLAEYERLLSPIYSEKEVKKAVTELKKELYAHYFWTALLKASKTTKSKSLEKIYRTD